ncbi:hypothetical protein [Flavobacterium selenitireducens]|uniref:hypothetical protein n=1 Tax=Flavobacterium selenitireducens TaxID=2722704 RepID=UPI00168B0F95|nr:hypothetical protein [Flavobacterium selenitireducens]MBD3583270.1 hypothetical protein [Flavobacterium selenitireducens]
MIKKIALLLSICALSSCNVAEYKLGRDTRFEQLNFSNGKWLLGFVEGPALIKSDITEKAKNDLSGLSNGRIDYLGDVRLLISEKTPMNPTKIQMKALRDGTGYDYFINLHCVSSRWVNERDFTTQYGNYIAMNTAFAHVICEVYDLKNQKIIYQQSCSGRLSEDESLTLKPSSTVLLSAYRKIIKDMENVLKRRRKSQAI